MFYLLLHYGPNLGMKDDINLTEIFCQELWGGLCLRSFAAELCLQLVNASLQRFPLGPHFLHLGLLVALQFGEEHPAHTASRQRLSISLAAAPLKPSRLFYVGQRTVRVFPPLHGGPAHENSGYQVPHTVWRPNVLLPRGERLPYWTWTTVLAEPRVMSEWVMALG